MKLRELKEKDAKGMLEWMHDSDIQKCFRYNMESLELKEAMDFIKKALVEPEEGKSIHYAIVNEGDDYLGTISLKDVNLRDRNAEYAISLRKMAQGRGIASEATMELLRLAFDRFDLERIYLNVLADNERAIHLYEKCGFIFEGEFKKHLFLRGEYKNLKWYRILREEYFTKFGEGGGISKTYIYALSIFILFIYHPEMI